MNYNFESAKPRYGMGSGKWKEVETILGREEDIIPFSVADMEFETAPEIKEAIIELVRNNILGYANPTDEYKNAVKKWLKQRHDWEIDTEWILPSHGIVDAFFSSVRCYSEEGEGVILLTPVYYPMYEAVENNGRVIADSPLINKNSRYYINFDDLEKKCADKNNTMMILCSPHNPSGRIWSPEELKKIGDLCNKNNIVLVSDEIHADLIMPGYKHVNYASVGKEYENNSVILSSASKGFNLAGLQTADVIIANEELRNKFFRLIKTMTSNPKCNIVGYKASETAYTKGGSWLKECIDVIYGNYKIIKEFMNKNYPEIEFFELESTYLLWMDFSKLGIDYKELEKLNKGEAKLFLDEGYIFGKEGEHFERWNIAAPRKAIEAALERFKTVYDRRLKR